MPECVALVGFGGMALLWLVWHIVVRAVAHDRIWRAHKNGVYGDPYKAEGLEE